MTADHHTSFQTDSRAQKYYFNNGKMLLLNFEEWLRLCCRLSDKNAREIVEHVRKVWSQLDASLSTGLATKFTAENLQDQWYPKFLTKVEIELKKPLSSQGDFYKPNTIASKLNSINKLLKFVIERKIFFGLVVEEICSFREVIATLTKGLSDKSLSRVVTVTNRLKL